jgi:hypothetical protein
MNRRRLLPSLLLLSLILASSAFVRGAEDKTLTTPWYPLVVGNTWTYRVGENRFSLKVTKLEKLGTTGKTGGTNCARLELIVNGRSLSFEHLAVTADSLVRYDFQGKEVNPPIPFLKLPPKKGATWTVESKIDGQVLKGSFTAGEEEVKVGAGKFKTATVTSKDLEVNGVKIALKYYFAQDVGMVKQEIDYAGVKAIVELEKFETPKKE